MPHYLDTTTLALRPSLPESQATGLQQITRAEYATAKAIPQKYRKWTGSAIEEMTQPEKDVVDAAEVQAEKDRAKVQVEAERIVKALTAATYKLVERIAGGGSMPTRQQFVNAIKDEVQNG